MTDKLRTSKSLRPSRRSVLRNSTAGLALLSFSSAGFSQVDATASDFAKTSAYLTGKSALNAELSAALLRTFIAVEERFADKLSRLTRMIEAGGVAPEALHQMLAANAPDLVDLPQSILMGWYSGVVGSGASAVCVTYADNLANAAVKDVLSPPSYAYGPCNSWAAPPV